MITGRQLVEEERGDQQQFPRPWRFPLQFGHEEHWTNERIFRYFNVSEDDRLIRRSNQLEANVIVMQKGPHLRQWLAAIFAALEHDIWMVTDRYNDEARQLHAGVFVENRHDQSLMSVSRKVVGSIVLSNAETYHSSGMPFLATRDRSARQ